MEERSRQDYYTEKHAEVRAFIITECLDQLIELLKGGEEHVVKCWNLYSQMLSRDGTVNPSGYLALKELQRSVQARRKKTGDELDRVLNNIEDPSLSLLADDGRTATKVLIDGFSLMSQLVSSHLVVKTCLRLFEEEATLPPSWSNLSVTIQQEIIGAAKVESTPTFAAHEHTIRIAEALEEDRRAADFKPSVDFISGSDFRSKGNFQKWAAAIIGISSPPYITTILKETGCWPRKPKRGKSDLPAGTLQKIQDYAERFRDGKN